jgi:hypothetical protein
MSETACKRCSDTGWIEPIGPCSDGSYITSRPCNCKAYDRWIDDEAAYQQKMMRERHAKTTGTPAQPEDKGDNR